MMESNGGSEAAHPAAKVSVQIELLPSSLQGLGSAVELPVGVRTLANQIAATGLTGRPLQIVPGQYLVAVELPDGSTHVEQTEITPTTQSVTLQPSDAVPADEAVRDPFEEFAVGIGPRPDIRPDFRRGSGSAALEDLTAEFARQYHEFRTSDPKFSGDLPAAMPEIRAEEVIASTVGEFRRSDQHWRLSDTGEGLASVTIPGEDREGRFALFERSRPDGTVQRLAVAVPAAVTWDVELVVADEPQLRIIPILENGRANTLLSYMAQQSYAHIATYANAQSESDFTELLFSKRSDPIGAAIGGYGLLSLNRFSPLEEWSENLTRVAPWLPDGYAIHGETQARLANHQKAAEYFHKMTRVGLPAFFAGLSYAETRIRLYTRHKLPSKKASVEMEAWLKVVSANVLSRLKLGEVLTTVIDPELDRV
ncbi:hypothetical protein GOL41_27035 [Sinorhizobium medicae]|nr:hypothetical protein [Sinorhizobium meliloti]MDX0351598.1 hypothetical protein [Sinorhizobium meliloti]MDX0499574.1 hypothetical protein [Sinorhizobium medicae]MDX1053371.1 hypothetical protein [Sinorhizobium medicae]